MGGIGDVTPNLGAMASQRPKGAMRGSVRNLLIDDGEKNKFPHTSEFFFRPNQVRESIRSARESMTVIGMSHQYKTYSYTENMVITFQVYANVLMLAKEVGRERNIKNDEQGNRVALAEDGRSDTQIYSMMLEDQRRFLEALNYPGWTPAGTIGSDLPSCILCLPGIVTMRCNLISLGILFKDEFVDGGIKEIVYDTSWEEKPMGRVSMQDVLEKGSFRTWGA